MAELSAHTREALQGLPKENCIDIILFQAERIATVEKENAELRTRLEQLEAKLNLNSTNSNQPPSSDTPYKKPSKKSGKHGKPGAKKGHRGYRQEMFTPDETISVPPKICSCGCQDHKNLREIYKHQQLGLPEEIRPKVTHIVVLAGECVNCGKVNKAELPAEYRTGYDPRLTAIIATLAGNHGDSRRICQEFCFSVLGFSISLGTIQKIIDRTSKAIEPHYEAIGEKARQSEVNHVDETSWFQNAKLCWLWVLANLRESFYMIHEHRSKEAFKALIKDWAGILISDGYGMYRKWVGLRQACLAHLIRKATALSESKNPDIAKFGKNAMKELQRRCHMAHAPPTIGQWQMFYARFIGLITRNIEKKDEAGKLARTLFREIDSLWLFLEKEGVSPTNNHAERMLRFAVCWRKRSLGTASDKGNRWVERILSLRQTCRLRRIRVFPILVDAIDSYFKEQKPDLSWI